MTTQEGAGTKFRWKVLAAGVRVRPADADMALLTGISTSTWTGTETEKADPKDYESTSAGWADGAVTETGWSFSLTVNKKVDSAQAVQLKGLKDAWASKVEIWGERLLPGATDWEGGVCSVKGPSMPAPADGTITFACTLQGRGAPAYTLDVP